MTASSEVPPFVLIERVAYTPRGTFGRLVIRDPGKGGNLLELWTVERPWLDNQARISCIPEGTYGLIPSRFYRGGYDAPEIRPVAGRSRILIHVGNTMDDVEGCVAVGLGLGVVRGQWAVRPQCWWYTRCGADRTSPRHSAGSARRSWLRCDARASFAGGSRAVPARPRCRRGRARPATRTM